MMVPLQVLELSGYIFTCGTGLQHIAKHLYENKLSFHGLSRRFRERVPNAHSSYRGSERRDRSSRSLQHPTAPSALRMWHDVASEGLGRRAISFCLASKVLTCLLPNPAQRIWSTGWPRDQGPRSHCWGRNLKALGHVQQHIASWSRHCTKL